jgi:hypothetical protein
LTISFNQFLFEGYKNLFSSNEKEKFAPEAYAQLTSAYEKVGGLIGKGFKDEQDFIDNIPFWKLKLNSEGHIIAAAYYRDKAGRKRVAVSTDGSAAGKKAIADILVSDLTQDRSYAEQSGPSLNFLAKTIGYPLVKKYAIPFDDFVKIAEGSKAIERPDNSDPEVMKHPELKSFFFKRKINGEWHTKIAIGTPFKKLNKKL